jgi:DNA-binding transcriptional LysR family regulator
MYDWNDLRYILSDADNGSTLKAASDLRVSQTTVARRIAALEEAVKLPLFDRRQAGYALTPAGLALVERARGVERAAAGFQEAAAGQARDTSGTVRLSTEEIFAVTLLGPWLKELHDLHPEIMIEVDTTQELRDLGAGEADIALRVTKSEQPAGVVGRRICVDEWTLYCSQDYAARHGVPKRRSELKGHALVAGGGGHVARAYDAWIRELGLEDQIAMQQPSSIGLLAAIRSGFGIAVLPCLLGDGEPDLIRCLPPREGHGRLMWLLTHERVRHTPRVRAAIDFLYDTLSARVRELHRAT